MCCPIGHYFLHHKLVWYRPDEVFLYQWLQKKRLENVNSFLSVVRYAAFGCGAESRVRESLSVCQEVQEVGVPALETGLLIWPQLKAPWLHFARGAGRIKSVCLDLTWMTGWRGFQNFVGNEHSEIPSGSLSLSVPAVLQMPLIDVPLSGLLPAGLISTEQESWVS